MKNGVEYFNTIAPHADTNLLYTGHEQCPPNKHCSGIRSHFLLHYVLSGSGWVHTYDTARKLSAGDLFCYFPEQAMSYASDAADPWHFAWVGFQGERAAEIVRHCGFSENRIICFRSFSQRIADRLAEIILVQTKRARGFELISDGLLLQFFGELMDALHNPAEKGSSPAAGSEAYKHFSPHQPQPYFYVEAMKRFIRTNYQKPISVQHVIDYIGVDRSYASRIFRRTENRTLQRYLIEQRMDAAKRLLSQKRLSIREVAHSVGYTDYASFERRFRIEAGCSPSEY